LWAPGDSIPNEFLEAASNPDWLISAFNNQFERLIETHIMAPRYGWPIIPIERQRCSQAAALALALPAKLEKVAEVLGLANQKHITGQRLMLQMSRPRKPRKDEDSTKTYWLDDPERRELLYKYSKQDCEVERELDQRIGHIPPEEQEHWRLDSVINDRGIALDKELIISAIRICETARREINAELQEITGGAIKTINQIAALKTWLSENGCEVDDTQDKTLTRALTRKNLAPAAKRAIELRLDGAHAAVNKFETMAAWLGDNDRVHGVYRYHGTSTGRWTSLGIQLQNLKRPEVADLGTAVEDVRAGDYHRLRAKYPRPLSIVGDIARATIIARPGHRLLIGDFSGIESRVLARVSGQQSKLDQWAKFDATGNPKDEPYFLLGHNNFGFPQAEARAKGKTGDLAFGYMGSIGAFRTLAPEEPATDEEVVRRREAWRRAHPLVVQFWRAIERAAIRAMQHPGREIEYRDVAFAYAGDFLKLRLPSGRCLSYPFPRLHTNDRSNLVVLYKDNQGGKWVDCHFGRGAYAGIWTENVVSAVARDLFAQAMQRLEAAGYPVVLHVHDEICCEVPNDFGSLEEFRRIITAVPDWAKGLPIASKVRESHCFAKIQPAPNKPIPDNRPAEEPRPQDVGATMRQESTNNRSRSGNGYDHYSSGEREWGSEVASYVYRDAQGEPYLLVKRTSAKQFPQYHWENGGWVKGKPAGPKIPYMLAELIAAPPSEPVFIAEGEKDADAVAILGLVATTNSEGATKGKWTHDLNVWFRGKQVAYVLEDNDSDGRRHVWDVANALRGIVPDIRIVSFPELPAGGDVSDWLEQGHSKSDLLARAAQAAKIPEKPYTLVRAEDVIPRALEWIWKGHLLRGSLELLTGLPGMGKSQAHCSLIAATTAGGGWPDGCPAKVPSGNVIMLTAEDMTDQIIIPRLIAAGANRERVYILKKIRRDDANRAFLLAEDIAILEQVIQDLGDVALVTLDPITAYMGGKLDSHKTTDVRSQLGPLADLAERTNVAISAITHPSKNAGLRAIDHFIGSQAFIAAARIGHICIEEIEENENGHRRSTGRSLFANAKNNPHVRMPSIAYRIIGCDLMGADLGTSKIQWEDVVEITADQALAAASPPKRESNAHQTFLHDVLTNGPARVEVVYERGAVRGFSVDQLKRAKRKMGVVAYKDGWQGIWLWALPQHVPAETPRQPACED
jgi:DNA polymerase